MMFQEEVQYEAHILEDVQPVIGFRTWSKWR